MDWSQLIAGAAGELVKIALEELKKAVGGKSVPADKFLELIAPFLIDLAQNQGTPSQAKLLEVGRKVGQIQAALGMGVV